VRVRVDTVIGGLAGITAIVTIAIFGYRVLSGDHGGDVASTAPPPPRLDGTLVGARVEIVDTDFRFRLVPPDPSWRLFDRAESDAAWIGTVAAMEGPLGLVQVIVDRVGDVTKEQVVDLAKAWFGKATAEEAISWLGRDAFESRADSARVRAFHRDGWIFRVFVGSNGDQLKDEHYEQVWRAFTLLDGTVRATPLSAPIASARGVDWRVKDDRWESASGLVVATPPGWRMFVGERLATLDKNADVQIIDDTIGANLVIRPGMVRPEPGAERRRIAIAGREMTLVRSAVPPNTYWTASIPGVTPDRVVEFWLPTSEGEAAATNALDTAVGAISFVSRAEREAVEKDLARDPAFRTAVLEHRAFRNGVYIDYRTGLLWRHPPGSRWRSVVEGMFEPEMLALVLPSAELTVVVGEEPDPISPAMRFARTGVRNVVPVKMGGNLSGGVEARTRVGKVQHVHRAAAIGESTLRVHVLGAASVVRAHEAELKQALGGLAIKKTSSFSDEGDEVIDRRLGYRVFLRGWKQDAKELAPDASHFRWTNPSVGMVGIVAQHRTAGARSRIQQARMARIASLAFQEGRVDSMRETSAAIDGEPAVRLSWYETIQNQHGLVTVTLVDRAEITYAIYTRGLIDAVAASERAFSFVDTPD
jgi:hypothetical protein